MAVLGTGRPGSIRLYTVTESSNRLNPGEADQKWEVNCCLLSTKTIIRRRGFVLLGGKSTPSFSPDHQIRHFSFTKSSFSFTKSLIQKQQEGARRFQAARSSLEPPDLPRLAETARISLTRDEVEEFAPKIQQVVDWFGQLQAVDLQSIEPAIRADTEGSNWRDDLPETFENRKAMIAAVPNYEEPYIKFPRVLNKEQQD